MWQWAVPIISVGDVPVKRVKEQKHLESVLMSFYHAVNILIKFLKKFHSELERSESSNHVWTEMH